MRCAPRRDPHHAVGLSRDRSGSARSEDAGGILGAGTYHTISMATLKRSGCGHVYVRRRSASSGCRSSSSLQVHRVHTGQAMIHLHIGLLLVRHHKGRVLAIIATTSTTTLPAHSAGRVDTSIHTSSQHIHRPTAHFMIEARSAGAGSQYLDSSSSRC